MFFHIFSVLYLNLKFIAFSFQLALLLPVPFILRTYKIFCDRNHWSFVYKWEVQAGLNLLSISRSSFHFFNVNKMPRFFALMRKACFISIFNQNEAVTWYADEVIVIRMSAYFVLEAFKELNCLYLLSDLVVVLTMLH